MPVRTSPRFGVLFLPSHRTFRDTRAIYDAMLEEAQLADALGLDALWIAEHHFDDYGGSIPSSPVVAATLAAHTKRIRIGSAVSPLPLRNALYVAEEFAMLDVLSGGRIDVGIGRGFLPHEFATLGIPYDDRRSLFDEGVAVLLGAWSGAPFSFAGKHYAFDDVRVTPVPLQRPHPPLWVAASLDRGSFEIAGTLGFNLMLNPYTRTGEELARGIGWYRDALRAAGHDAGAARVLVNQHLFVAPDEHTAASVPRDALLHYLEDVAASFARGVTDGRTIAPTSYDAMYPERVMFGTPDVIEAKIRAWLDFGATDFSFVTQFGELPVETTLASTRLFAERVLPRFR